MKLELQVSHHHAYYADSTVVNLLNQVLAAVRALTERMEFMSAEMELALAELAEVVALNGNRIDSAVEVITALLDQIETVANDPAQVLEATATMRTQIARLATAIDSVPPEQPEGDVPQ